MYLGHIQHPTFALPSPIEKALDYLRHTDLIHLDCGRYPIDGENMFALVQDPVTQSWEKGEPEFHAKYIDVQYLIEGEEMIGYLPAHQTLTPSVNQLEDNDIAFVSPQEKETRLILTPGMFAVFYPGELHRPCRSVTTDRRIKKVVVKIAIKT